MAGLGEVQTQSHVIQVGVEANQAFDTLQKLKQQMVSLSNVSAGKGDSIVDVRGQRDLVSLLKQEDELRRRVSNGSRMELKDEQELNKTIQAQLRTEQMSVNLAEKKRKIVEAIGNATTRNEERVRRSRENDIKAAFKSQEDGYKGEVDGRGLDYQIERQKERYKELLGQHQEYQQALFDAGVEVGDIYNPIENLPASIEDASNSIKKTLIQDFKNVNQQLDSALDKLNQIQRNKELDFKYGVDSRKLDFQIQKSKGEIEELFQRAGDSAQGIQNPFDALPEQMENMSNTMKGTLIDAIRQTKRELQELDAVKPSFLEEFGEKFGKIANWMSAVWALMALKTAFSEAIETIMDMQVAMIDLQKVMSSATADFDMMRDAAFELGKEMGRLPEEAARAMYLFAKQGKEQVEVLELTKTALMATNVAELSLENSVEYLTSSILQMGLTASDSMTVLDQWNEVSNKNAVSTQQLAEAYQQTASVAKNLGIDMHELNAIITLIAANTGKAGGEIGRMLKTSLQRAYSDEFKASLASILDINMYDPATGKMKEFGDVLLAISRSWDTLSDAQQDTLSSALGGQRYINDMIILFENLDKQGLKVAAESMTSFGSASRENQKYMQSLERQIDSAKASLRDLFVSVGDSGLIDVFSTGLDLVGGFVDLINILPKPIKQVGLSLLTVKAGGAIFSKVFGGSSRVILPLINSLGGVSGALSTVASGASTALVAFRTWSAGIPIIGALTSKVATLGTTIYAALGPWGVLAGAILAGAAVYQSFKRSAATSSVVLYENALAMRDATKAAQEKLQALMEVQGAVGEVEGANLSEIEAQSKQQRAVEKFNNIIPDVINNYDELRDSINGVVKAQRDYADSTDDIASKLGADILRDFDYQMERQEQQIAKLESAWQSAIKWNESGHWELAQNELKAVGAMGPWDGALTFGEDAQKSLLYKGLDELQNLIREAKQELSSLNTQRATFLSEGAVPTEATASMDAFLFLIESYGKYSVQLQKISSDLASMSLGDTTISRMGEINEYIGSQKEILEDYGESIENYFDNTGRGLEHYIEYIRAVTSDVSQHGVALWSEDTLNVFKNKEARDFLASLTEGSEEYYGVLGKIIDAEDYFANKLDDKQKKLERAFEVGAISATSYYAELVRIEDLRLFEKQRETIREMNEELRSGTVSALEEAFRGLISGEKDAFQKFQESINKTQTSVLSQGLTSFVESSDYFRETMARQQNAIATLFGGQDTTQISIDEKLLSVQVDQRLILSDIADTLDNVAGNLSSDIAVTISDGSQSYDFAGFMSWLEGQNRDLYNYFSVAAQTNTTDQSLLGMSTGEYPEYLEEFNRLLERYTAEGAQKRQGFAPDIIDNPRYSSVVMTDSERELFARLVAAEARGESREGQAAVVGAVLNRVLSSNYPDSIESVIMQGGQFEPVSSKSIYSNEAAFVNVLPEMANLIDEIIATGKDYSGGASSFFNPDISSDAGAKWHKKNKYYGTIGNHAFSGGWLLSDFPTSETWDDSNSTRIKAQKGDRLWDWQVDHSVPYQLIQAVNDMKNTTVTEGKEYIIPTMEWFESNIPTVEDYEIDLLSVMKGASESIGDLGLQSRQTAADIKSATIYIVQAGDNFSKIADRLGVELSELLDYNRHISDPNKIQPGQVIYLSSPSVIDGQFAKGGFTSGNKIAGVVHENEWVAPEWMLRGFPGVFANLEQVRKRGFSDGGYTSSTTGISVGSLQSHDLSTIQKHVGNIDVNTQAIGTNTDNLNQSFNQSMITWESVGEHLPGVVRSVDNINREVIDYSGRVSKSTSTLVGREEETQLADYQKRVSDEIARSWERRFDEFFRGTVKVLDSKQPITGYLSSLADSIAGLNSIAADAVSVFGGKNAKESVGGMVDDWTASLGMPSLMASPISGFAKDAVGALFGQSDFLNLLVNAFSIFGMVKSVKKEFKGFSLTKAFGFSDGGYTGGNQKFAATGVVHEGEFVIPKWMVDKYPDIISALEGVRQKGYRLGGGVRTAIPSFSPLEVRHNDNISVDIGKIASSSGQIERQLKQGGTSQKTTWMLETINASIEDVAFGIFQVQDGTDRVARVLQSQVGPVSDNVERANDFAVKSMFERFAGRESAVNSVKREPIISEYMGGQFSQAAIKASNDAHLQSVWSEAGDYERYFEILTDSIGRGEVGKYQYDDILAGMPQEELDNLMNLVKQWVSVNPDDFVELSSIIGDLYSDFIDSTGDGLRFLQEFAVLKAQEISEADADLLAKMSGVFKTDTSVTDWSSAMQSPKQWQNAMSGLMMNIAQTGSTSAGILGMLSGFMKNTTFEVDLGEKLADSGLEIQSGSVSDVLNSFGAVIGGMKQNLEEEGSGMTNLLTGLSGLAGAFNVAGMGAGPWAAIASIATPLISGFFQRTKEEEQKEAERIGNTRHFVSSGDGFNPSERFYMSGQHASLLRGDATSMTINLTNNIDAKGDYDEQALADKITDATIRKISDKLPGISSAQYRREYKRGARL